MIKTNPTEKAMISVLLISMVASISFGIIDSINFLFIEDRLSEFWKSLKFLNDTTIPLVNGGIAAAISILLALYIASYLELHYTFFKHPVLEATGVIVGTILVILFNKLYTKYSEKQKAEKHAI